MDFPAIDYASKFASQALGQATLGVLLHVSFISIEPEFYVYKFIRLYVAAFIIYLAISVFQAGVSTATAIGAVVLASLTVWCGFLASLSVYRLFFHRLRSFPGPFWARLSKFYAVKAGWKRSQWHRELEKLHEQYGDIVRIGPRELSVRTADAIPVIYGSKSKCRKTTWYNNSILQPERAGLHEIRDHAHHRVRQRAYDRALGVSAVKMYEPKVMSKVSVLISNIERMAGTPMDMTHWSILYNFDVMGDVALGTEFDNLSAGVKHPAIATLHSMLRLYGMLGHVPWLLNLLSNIPRGRASQNDFEGWCEHVLEEKQKAFDKDEAPGDIISFLLKAKSDKDPSAPSDDALTRDCMLITTAGSDTTYSALTCAIFFLATHPAALRRLQHDLDAATTARDWTYERVKDVPFLDAVINETLRLKPPVPSSGARVTPTDGITVGGTWVPGDVNLLVPAHVVHRYKTHYKQAGEFIPERWLENEGKDVDERLMEEDAAFYPFSQGAYRCPGKNLAMMNLRVAISRVVQRFDVRLAEGETGERFLGDETDCFTIFLPGVNLIFTEREG